MKQTIAILITLLTTLSIAAQNSISIEQSRERLKCSHKGIRRCVRLDITSPDIAEGLDSVRLVFVTDTHYASRFTSKTLTSLGNMLRELKPDIILLGGDYQEGCQYVDPLFDEIMSAQPRYGAFAVLGNNDLERCTEMILSNMRQHGITPADNTVNTININGSRLVILGAQNTFAKRETIPCPDDDSITTNDFVMLITHTPDYIEDVECPKVDFTVAGHLHGGQVTLFGLYAPILPSHYGQRFRHGIKYNSHKQPVLCSNGIGTSRRNIRFCAAPEIHLIVLHSKK